jgi:hypothetical protein
MKQRTRKAVPKVPNIFLGRNNVVEMGCAQRYTIWNTALWDKFWCSGSFTNLVIGAMHNESWICAHFN